MLPKKKRVTKDLFQNINKNGRTIQGSLFMFKYIHQTNPQYAFVAPKTLSKRAVDRNSLRRKGYNTLRLLTKIPLCAGIFFYKKSAKMATSVEIKADISAILSRVNA